MLKRYVYPLLIILIISLGLNLLRNILQDAFFNPLFIILNASLLFAFGMHLNIYKRSKNQAWFKKLVISFFLIFFLVWQLDYIMIPELKGIFNMLGINGSIISLVYIYCGWAFFD